VCTLFIEFDAVISGDTFPSPQFINNDGVNPPKSTKGHVNTVFDAVVVTLNTNGNDCDESDSTNLLNILITLLT
jgi:hypothetical protein